MGFKLFGKELNGSSAMFGSFPVFPRVFPLGHVLFPLWCPKFSFPWGHSFPFSPGGLGTFLGLVPKGFLPGLKIGSFHSKILFFPPKFFSACSKGAFPSGGGNLGGHSARKKVSVDPGFTLGGCTFVITRCAATFLIGGEPPFVCTRGSGLKKGGF